MIQFTSISNQVDSSSIQFDSSRLKIKSRQFNSCHFNFKFKSISFRFHFKPIQIQISSIHFNSIQLNPKSNSTSILINSCRYQDNFISTNQFNFKSIRFTSIQFQFQFTTFQFNFNSIQCNSIQFRFNSIRLDENGSFEAWNNPPLRQAENYNFSKGIVIEK